MATKKNATPRKSITIKKVIAPPKPEIDPVENRALGMSLALEMKRMAAEADRKSSEKSEESVALDARPKSRARGRDSQKFSQTDLKEFRRRLQAARSAASDGVNAMKHTGFNESEDHEADGGDGTAQSLRLQALGQMGNINRVIQQIDEALHRIDDGTYGVCTSCGQLIRKPRLLNQPFVLTCMECQQEMERGLK